VIRKQKRKQINDHHAQGFTLIEVLVALVVMAVGMLGVAVLFVEGLQLNRTSMYRANAVALATDMAGRIRANPDINAGYAGAGPGALGDCDNGPPCTPDELADDDWLKWRTALDANLPAGYVATIDEAPAGPGNRMRRFDINLSWSEVGSPNPVTYTLSVQL